MLHNERYVGTWTFGKRKWTKVPGSNRRRSKKQQKCLTQQRPHLRIIDADTWEAVEARLKAVAAKYKRLSGPQGGHGAPGRATKYPLSGLLFCGECGGNMVINGGAKARRYACGDRLKRGTCGNRITVREEVARTRILEVIEKALISPWGVAHVRKKLAERLGDKSRRINADLTDHQKRLARTEQRIAGLVEFIADGDRSEYVLSALRDLETQATAEKRAIQALEREAQEPVRIPNIEETIQRVFELRRRIEKDPVGGREALRRHLKDGRIVLEPQQSGVYLARCSVLPLGILLTETESKSPPGDTGRRSTAISCGGRI